MEAKEEISDTDSGIILHSGPDSPTTVMKDVSTHTRAVKLKRQSLEDRLELCLLELKKLCIREAELTGHLSSDYPLLPGEKPPQIRRRIGAAFKLDEQSILHRGGEDSELRSVEAKLALQQQIHVAARKLCQEEHLSKAVRKSRLQQSKREEQKLKELQEAVFQLRLDHGRSSPRPGLILQKLQGTSDDSSLSDSAVLDEEELTSQSSQVSSEPPPTVDSLPVPPGTSHRPLTPTGTSQLLQLPVPSPRPLLTLPLEPLHPCPSPTMEHDPAPIQNSPWTESSLDQPYQKKKSRSSSTKSSPAVTPTLPPLKACLEEAGITLQVPGHASLRHIQSSSAPSTPELHLRRGYSLRVPNSEPPNDVELDRGRLRAPRRRLTDVLPSPSPEYSPIRLATPNPMYHDSSEDSNSEHSSAPSYMSSPCQDHSFELQRQACQSHQSHYRYHYPSPTDHYIPQPYSPLSHYKTPPPQLSPNYYRGYMDEGRSHDMDMSRMYIRPQPPPSCANGHYEYWYEEAPPHPLYRQIPAHVKLSRAPSLREYPHHPSRGLPRQVVSEELKSWHQRSQLRPPRPRSLDRHRQGAVRVRTLPGQESPLPRQHGFHDPQQVPQRRIIQRTADGTPIKWYEDDDAEIVSQV
ncbi:innate immunity activator protein isoform X1 [Astyanax mexicanus]|uniref:Innate immunity activator protein isoform X1 n=1 Tax=Astyanax mexicanus TaxID=7994 RepID=A0A8T2KM74_ASTMX|nr:innate immunity activator protein isoform X1 [Astyanax mexicanus]